LSLKHLIWVVIRETLTHPQRKGNCKSITGMLVAPQ
jgi:hypothetical protein